MSLDYKVDYKKAGVDVEAGDALVDWLQSDQDQKPHFNRIVSGIGGFASLFRASFSEYKKPCLVTCTDGVGTKVKLASYFGDYSTIGQDLVAMCVNDLICTGGDPLLFLDYYAVGKLDLTKAKSFLEGVKKACKESDSALVGGETAEMPGVYQDGDFDCAGFSVGVVDEDMAWGADKVKEGDQLIGINSSGFHSNGYSLLRRVFADDLERYRQELMEPTALYVQLAKQLKKTVPIHAAAHITGGGIENIPRVLPSHLSCKLEDWDWPPIFKEVQRRTQMSKDQMLKTLNCGLGFVFILPPGNESQVTSVASKLGFKSFPLGTVTKGTTS